MNEIKTTLKKAFRVSLVFLLILHSSGVGWADTPGGVSSNLQLWFKADTGVTGSSPVTQWDDQSGNSNNGSADGDPTLHTDSINFNPIIRFDGSGDGFTISDSHKITGTSDFAIFVVIKSTFGASSVEQLVNSGDADSGRGQFRFQNGNLEVHENGDGDVVVGGTSVIDGTPKIGGGQRSGNDFSIFLNGAVDGGPTTDSSSFPAATTYLIGRDPSASQDLDGDLAEIAVYNAAVSAADRQKIESYLAVKYGVTLSTDYVNAGGTVIWDGDGTNASFNNDVAGLGQDDDAGLNQIKSKSQNTGAVVTMRSATSQNNGDFLIWGNNGENQATWVSTNSTANYMYLGLTTTDRIEWRATETNSIGSVTIEVDESDLPTFEDPLYIVIDTDDDEDLTDETPQQMSSIGSNLWTYTHNFSNGGTNTAGQEFTFAQEISTPLNVCGSNLKLWLDADDPTTLHTDAACTSAAPTNGTDVKCWEDKSSNADDVTEISGDCDEGTSGTQTCGVPTYRTDEFNGRPALEFVRSENDAMRHILSSTWSSTFSFFIAFAQVGTPDTFYAFFSNGTPAGTDHFQIDTINDGGDRTFRYFMSSSDDPLFEPFSNDLKLYSVLALSSGTTTYADGALRNTSSETHGRIFEHYRVNQNRAGSQRNNAKISEVILCDTVLGTCDFSRMNKYMGDKYARDFSGINSQYDYTVNHGTDTTGIGFDTSGVTCSPAVVYDNASSSIVSLRINSPYDTGHNLDTTNQDERLSIGHNGGALTETTSQVPSPYSHRLNRVWRADQDDGTGSDGIQDVILSLDLSATSIDTSSVVDFALLLDSDGDFSNATAHTAGVTITNSIIRFTGVDFTDGDYFTLATQGPNPAPGGVTGNLQFWVKANEGVKNGGSAVSHGDDADEWEDQSGNTRDITQSTSADQPDFQTNAANFNPALHFDGTSDYMEAAAYVAALNGNNMHVFSVHSATGGAGNFRAAFSSRDPDLSGNNTEGYNLYLSDGDVYSFWTGDHTSSWSRLDDGSTDAAFEILAVDTTNGVGTATKNINRNGNNAATTTTGTYYPQSSEPYRTGAAHHESGGSVVAQFFWTGFISEQAVYNVVLSTTNQNKVESYFAIKYGVTLDQSGGGIDYTDSSDSEIWDKDAADASTYNNDIAGIGQDSLSELDQRISRSSNSDGIVTVATTNDFTSTNEAATRESLGSGNFLMWGNDNSTNTWVTSNSPDKFQRLDREWSVQETGTVGNVHIAVQVDDSDFDVPKFKGNLHFVYDTDNDGSLKDETPLEMVDAGSGSWTISNIDFTTGMEFTFASRKRRRVIISR